MLFFISLFNIIAIAGIAFWWWRSLDGAIRIIFWPALIWKLAAGIGVGLLYKYYYSSGDTFQFFSTARELTNLFYSSISDYSRIIFQEVDLESAYKGEWRTAFFVKMISVVNIFTISNYWISSLWFSFLSFLASFYFFRNVVKHFPTSEIIAALAFLFFPSVIFWSSGIIKESVGLAALFILSTPMMCCTVSVLPTLARAKEITHHCRMEPTEKCLSGFSLMQIMSNRVIMHR